MLALEAQEVQPQAVFWLLLELMALPLELYPRQMI
jgi:hypothetical protein